MVSLDSITELYRTYIEKVDFLEKNRKIGEGIFGLKGGPEDDVCHDIFAENVEQSIKEFMKEEHDPEEVCGILSYMLMAPYENPQPKTAYWMLIGVQALAIPLIGQLKPKDAAALYERYKNCYPRWERLPVQKKVLQALKERK